MRDRASITTSACMILARAGRRQRMPTSTSCTATIHVIVSQRPEATARARFQLSDRPACACQHPSKREIQSSSHMRWLSRQPMRRTVERVRSVAHCASWSMPCEQAPASSHLKQTCIIDHAVNAPRSGGLSTMARKLTDLTDLGKVPSSQLLSVWPNPQRLGFGHFFFPT